MCVYVAVSHLRGADVDAAGQNLFDSVSSRSILGGQCPNAECVVVKTSLSDIFSAACVLPQQARENMHRDI